MPTLNRSGFTALSVLVAGTLIGGLMLTLTRSVTHANRSTRQLSGAMELASLSSLVQGLLNHNESCSSQLRGRTLDSELINSPQIGSDWDSSSFEFGVVDSSGNLVRPLLKEGVQFGSYKLSSVELNVASCLSETCFASLVAGFTESGGLQVQREYTAVLKIENPGSSASVKSCGLQPTTNGDDDAQDDSYDIDLTITSDQFNYNIENEARAAGWDGTSPKSIRVTIRGGVYVGSRTTSLPAMETGNLSAASEVLIVNHGFILGTGGAGSGGQFNSLNGQGGGPALRATSSIQVQNENTIGGGGGGGNGGYGVGGGGGQGSNPGGASAGGSPGSRFNPGSGRRHTWRDEGTNFYTQAGSGGGLGQAGRRCSSNDPGTCRGNPGGPGAAIIGKSLVVLTTNGTILGAQIP